MNIHSTYPLTYPFTGEKIDVDRGVWNAIKYLWDNGFKTVSSCQGGVIVFEKDPLFGHDYVVEIMQDYGGLQNVRLHTCDDCEAQESEFFIYNFDPVG